MHDQLIMHDHIDNIVIKVLIILCQTDLSLANPLIVDIVLFNRESWVHPPPEMLIYDDNADNEDNDDDAEN